MKTTPARKENYFLYNASLKERARELRNFQTRAEKILWEIVRKKRLYGFTFNRQRSALEYIVDFMCKELLLILEADGESHQLDKQKEYDEERTAKLEAAGFCIIRFQNWDIENRPDLVEADIRAWIRKKTGIEEE